MIVLVFSVFSVCLRCLCVCVCVCVCLSVCLSVCMCLFTVCVCFCLCACVCLLCVCLCVCVCLPCVCVCVCARMCLFTVCVSVSVCAYVFVYCVSGTSIHVYLKILCDCAAACSSVGFRNVMTETFRRWTQKHITPVRLECVFASAAVCCLLLHGLWAC